MAALPTAIFPSNLDNNDTNNDKVLRQLQKISSELGRLRSDVTAIRTAQPPTQEPQQQAITKEINLEDLLEVGTTKPFRHQVATASEHNKLARSYNSVLLNHQDFIAPLRNYRNKPVFGFPETLGALVSLDSAAEKLLCGAFGIPYVMNEYSFAIFCGFCPQLLDSISRHAPTGGDIALIRMLTRNKRARDVFLVDPTPQTRRAAAMHNIAAQKLNAAAHRGSTTIIPLRDPRNLEVPGFPKMWEWLSVARKKDVLWLLGEFGLSVEPQGCMKRFEEFIGIRPSPPGQRGVEWLL